MPTPRPKPRTSPTTSPSGRASRSRSSPTELRCLTYLAPSIPRAFYEGIAEYLTERLGRPVRLDTDPRRSGPLKADDPFGRGEADLGFMCAPSYLWLRELERPTIELLAAPVHTDPRNEGCPVYFSDVVVPRASEVARFDELAGTSWAYNDDCSLSGYYNMLSRIVEVGGDATFFAEAIASGSHLRSLELVARGEVGAAAIDSNVLALQRREDPSLAARIRVLESLGPHAIQPVVVRADLERDLKDALAAALFDMADDRVARTVLLEHQVERFVAGSHDVYEHERLTLERARRGGFPTPA